MQTKRNVTFSQPKRTMTKDRKDSQDVDLS